MPFSPCNYCAGNAHRRRSLRRKPQDARWSCKCVACGAPWGQAQARPVVLAEILEKEARTICEPRPHARSGARHARSQMNDEAENTPLHTVVWKTYSIHVCHMLCGHRARQTPSSRPSPQTVESFLCEPLLVLLIHTLWCSSVYTKGTQRPSLCPSFGRRWSCSHGEKNFTWST